MHHTIASPSAPTVQLQFSLCYNYTSFTVRALIIPICCAAANPFQKFHEPLAYVEVPFLFMAARCIACVPVQLLLFPDII